MMIGEFMELFEVEKCRLRELSWANKHATHELAKDDRTRCHPKYTRCGCKTTKVMKSNADW